MSRFAYSFFVLAGVLTFACAEAADGDASYVLTWDDTSFPDLHVNARIHVVNGMVKTSGFWSTFFDDDRGWASFIDIDSAVDDAGTQLDVRRGESNTWQIGDQYTGVATLSYSVDFGFASEQWSMGSEQVALSVDGGLYTTGLPVFVYSADLSEIDVQIAVAPGWNVTTAWPSVGDKHFKVSGFDRLTRNTIAIGRFHAEEFKAGAFAMRLALLGEVGESADLVRTTFSSIFEFYRELYKPDEAAQFMIAMIPGPNDGEAYFDSFAAATPEPPDENNLLVWANLLAHEFGHYWNGKRFTTSFENSAERQWFSEGGTEYIANQALRETGLMDEQSYLQVMARYLSMHLIFTANPRFDGISLRMAGEAKWANRPGVYDSGAAAAYCLDGLIQHHSDGSRSFADMLRLLNERFGNTPTLYQFNDLIDAASEVAGADMTAFFDAHISGDEPLPVVECARMMGNSALVDGYHVHLR